MSRSALRALPGLLLLWLGWAVPGEGSAEAVQVPASAPAATANAGPATAAGRQESGDPEARVRAYLDGLLGPLSGCDAEGARAAGVYHLEPLGREAYRAHFPSLRLRLAVTEGDEDALCLELEPLTLELVPVPGNEGRIRIRIGQSLAARLRPVTSKEGAEDGLLLRIGRASGWAEWVPAFQAHTDGVLRFTDWSVNALDEPWPAAPLRLAALVAEFSLERPPQGADWVQESSVSLSGLRFTPPPDAEEPVALGLEELEFSGRVAGDALERFMASMRELAVLAEGREDPDRALRLTLDLLGLVRELELQYGLEGLEIRPAGASPVSVRRAYLGLGGQRQGEGDWRLRFALGYQGLEGAAAVGGAQASVPQEVALELRLAHLPLGVLGGMIREAGQGRQVPQEEAALRLVAALFQSGAAVEQGRFVLRYPQYGLRVDLRSRVDAQSPLLTVGEAEVEVTGFPRILAEARARGVDAETRKLLTALALMSERSERDGRTLDRYRIRWTRQGRVLINGRDASELLGLPAAPPPGRE